jgi:hypothetical protein
MGMEWILFFFNLFGSAESSTGDNIVWGTSKGDQHPDQSTSAILE